MLSNNVVIPPRRTNQLLPVPGLAFGVAVTIDSTIGVASFECPVRSLPDGFGGIDADALDLRGPIALLGANGARRLSSQKPVLPTPLG
jgi:hypothetical protein